MDEKQIRLRRIHRESSNYKYRSHVTKDRIGWYCEISLMSVGGIVIR